MFIVSYVGFDLKDNYEIVTDEVQAEVIFMHKVLQGNSSVQIAEIIKSTDPDHVTEGVRIQPNVGGSSELSRVC